MDPGFHLCPVCPGIARWGLETRRALATLLNVAVDRREAVSQVFVRQEWRHFCVNVAGRGPRCLHEVVDKQKFEQCISLECSRPQGLAIVGCCVSPVF